MPDASEYGDASFTEERIEESGLLDDIKALGPNVGADALALIQEVMGKGKPYDDRTMVMEKVMKLTASLPPNSKMRKKLSDTIIKTMWGTLQHPPQSYYGDDYQYRTADGSNNNVMIPQLGKAGMPYAKSVRTAKGLHGAKPDPGLLFDLLLARPDGSFRANKAGINSMLFYHATVIIHDLFRTSHKDFRISDTSSYLDLSPLYGKDQKAQDTVRTFKDGKLKPDTFAEERLIGQPPGTCVFLVMYNRFHNYVAENLAEINDGGRFTMPRKGSENYDAALKKRDYDLFQTARLIVCGLYMNITLHDYIRGITNVHHSTSTWTIEPRVDILNDDGSRAVELGVGNQVSSEFNLLYRFHSAVSQRDDKWTAMFFKELFGDRNPAEIPVQEFVAGALAWEAKIPKEPSERVFGGLKRNPETGTFDDDAMVQILKESIEDPAGAFGARNVPKHLRTVDILGIIRARQWQTASLNEFRRYFGLKEHTEFEQINPDPEIADLLRKLYDSPDMVELYPGLFVEDIKARMDPGSGIGIPYTAGRAVLSDAVGFIRGDRFFTVDYTASNLTPWGMAEVQQDYLTLGGSVFYRLIQRAFPKWFKFNSVYVMQPMYLPSMNVEIFKEFKTIDQYSLDPPAPPPKATVLHTKEAIGLVINDQKNFKVSYSNKLPDSASADFMICGDCAANKANHTKLSTQVTQHGGYGIFSKTIELTMRKVLAREAYKLKDLYQVDMTKDVARVVMLQTHADFLNLPLATKENGQKGLSESEMYKHLETYLNYSLIDNDPAESWRLRRQAQASYEKLKAATEEIVHGVARSDGFLGHMFGSSSASAGSLRELGQKYTKDLLHAGCNEAKTVTILYTTAAGMVGPLSSLFAQTLEWFLKSENASHWTKVRELAADKEPASYEKLKQYVLEASRFQSTFPNTRLCQSDSCQIKDNEGHDVTVKKGEIIVTNHMALLRDPTVFHEPEVFKADRPLESYHILSWAPETCCGREIAIVALTSMVKVAATIKNLRAAPGPQGEIKYIPGPLGSKKFLSDDWKCFQPFAG
ncbi:MAG: hypothetical protein Q9187_002483, partial [Circinaria calcarea]